MESEGLEVAPDESVSEWWDNRKAQDVTVRYCRCYKHYTLRLH